MKDFDVDLQLTPQPENNFRSQRVFADVNITWLDWKDLRHFNRLFLGKI